MAADSSIDETEAAAAATEEKPAAAVDKPNGPPRPPRPVRRMSGSLRIPLPSAVTPGSKQSATRTEPVRIEHSARTEPMAAEAATSAQPAGNTEAAASVEAAHIEPAAEGELEPVLTLPSPGIPARRPKGAKPPQLDPQNIPTPLPPVRPSSPPAASTSPSLPGDSASNLEFSLTRRSSGAPPLSFDSEDVDPSDRAPVAPLTPWRDVPPLKAAEESSNPPPVAIEAENDREDTLVGQVPQNLLELASEEDAEEHTRAYQAPQELIELARREREERRQAREGQKRDAKKKFADSIPPAARAADELEDDQSDVATATVPLDSLPPGDAAPPVALSGAQRGVTDEPSFGRKVSNGPASLEELAAAVSGPGERESIPVVSEVLSEDRTPDSLSELSAGAMRSRSRGRLWMLLVGVVIVVGFVLARWGGVELPLSR
jgi:hypothetical protein